MTALTKDRNTAQRLGDEFNHPLAASAVIFMGSLVVLDSSGNAAPGTAAAGLICAGRSEENVDNGAGIAGDKTVQVRKGVFQFANVGTVTRAHIGDTGYISDDQTISQDATGKSSAGKIVDVDADGVWVQIS